MINATNGPQSAGCETNNEFAGSPIPRLSRRRCTSWVAGRAILAVFSACAATMGCVRRTLTVTSEPANALLVLNEQEIGRTDVTTDFLWYGDYDVVLRKEGYKTLHTHWPVKPPWYQIPPLDFFFDVLWPGQLHDQHAQHFVLEVEQLPTPDEVTERAVELRESAVNPGP